ncbi:hypothetical protein THAOC_02146 [Thalassiosira oceanica]|uniref:Uncharacterized protein n=1 Tax=Thalassiosira oceanica TaxID=159749 RepID=K0TQI5_THAOC|nr:hypothetical protein THAOC_02146 [Thalassiosira oceanica]|eukprot:EJK76107.1 hypothetical protein THAOC_02146 [Thalassiosira oceanica]
MRASALFHFLLAAAASAAGEGSVRGTGLLEPLYPDDRELALFAEARRSDVTTARAESLDRGDVAATTEMRAELGAARSAEMRSDELGPRGSPTQMRSDELGAARSAEMRSDELGAARSTEEMRSDELGVARSTEMRSNVDIEAARLDDGRVTDARAVDARLDDGKKVVMEENPYGVPIP